MTHRHPQSGQPVWSRLLALAGLVGLSLTATDAGAQTARTATTEPHLHGTGGHFVLHAAPGGGLTCFEAPEAVAAKLVAENKTMSGKVRLTPLPRLRAGVGTPGLKIQLRATDQLLANPVATLAFRRAAARWEEYITTPMTVVLDVDYGPQRFGTPYAPNVLGSTSSAQEFPNLIVDTDQVPVTVAQFVQRLKDKHPGDPQLQALYNAIPIPTPTTARNADGSVAFLQRPGGSQANMQALGFRAADSEADAFINPFGAAPAIGFNSGFSYDFEPADGISAGRTDFDAVVTHEIGHALGFVSIIGNGGPANGNLFYTWDMFRVRPEAVQEGDGINNLAGWSTAERVVTPGPTRTPETGVPSNHVFYDGKKRYELSTATGGRLNGDGQQASHWRADEIRPATGFVNPTDRRTIGIMDPTISSGVRDIIREADLRALEVMGYGINYTPAVGRISAVSSDTLRFGNLEIGQSATLAVGFQNLAATAPLIFESPLVSPVNQPSNVTPSVSLNKTSGTVAAGASDTLKLTVSATARGVFSGLIRLRTNDTTKLVIDVPYLFSVGGATAPRVAITRAANLGFPTTIGVAETVSRSFTLGNQGNLPLTYQVAVGLSAPSAPVISTAPNRPIQPGFRADALRTESPLARFFNEGALKTMATLFSADFESGDAGFTQIGTTSAVWQRVTTGKAPLDGHTRPTAFYFGNPATFTYPDGVRRRLISPTIDLSSLAPSVRTVLAFNYYLDGEKDASTVYDVARVLLSTDNGATYREIANSQLNGVLINSTAGWQSALISLSNVAGLNSVRIAFEFSSDSNTTAEGWYVDDVMVSTADGVAAIFATPAQGTVPDPSNPATITVTVNGAELAPNFYTASVVLRTNDLKQPTTNLSFDFKVGDPKLPTLVLSTGASSLSTSVVAGQAGTVTTTVRNDGALDLSYVRVLEPALSRFTDPGFTSARLAEAAALRASATSLSSRVLTMEDDLGAGEAVAGRLLADGDSLYSGVIPNANNAITFPGGATQLPDGRILVVDVNNAGRTFVFNEQLQLLETRAGLNTGTTQTGGIAYMDRTNTIWYAQYSNGQVYEVRLDGTATGRRLNLSFAPFGMAYSDELGALIMLEGGVNRIHAIDVSGATAVELPGYPATFSSTSANVVRSLAVTGGVFELNTLNLQVKRTDQFGRVFTTAADSINTFGAGGTVNKLGGSGRINGIVRSRTNPNGLIFYVANAVGPATPTVSGTVSRIIAFDPRNLSDRTRSIVKANTPLYGLNLAPNGTKNHTLRVDATLLAPGAYSDTLAFLTNNADDRIVRIPVSVTVAGVIPVELASFTARTVGSGRVLLEWATTTEKSNAGFEVERQSTGGWQKLATVAGHGTTTEAQQYRYTDGTVPAGLVRYRLKQVDLDGTSSYSPTVEIGVGAPAALRLTQNSPNPFNPATTIEYALPTAGRVRLTVFDLLGRQVATLVDELQTAGGHTVRFDGSALASGTYIYRLEAGTTVRQLRMTLVK